MKSLKPGRVRLSLLILGILIALALPAVAWATV
jgi:hypothetical protein